MAKIKKPSIDCCGSSFKTDKIPMIGLLTFSLPSILIGYAFLVLMFPFCFLLSIQKLRNKIQIINNANLKLIEKQSFFSMTKCNLVAFFSKHSSLASSFLFKYFNILILFIIWFFILIGLYFVI